ncbi:peroxiredoxin-like family protein [Jeotgalibacillus campisalis]|uniref:thioredoxin-dependent peroxiredoxin n=1 Tax=Jeotgalibacillus campisalis TaxID=220754 RepID=A0A0C2VIC9_9BACL|nr:peroxiredoxin-like family protein [Jeotgalibacillus campisalis]KIL43763.1 alkyl hydroperoxide reductase [Jeotgalibacillus campisalis]
MTTLLEDIQAYKEQFKQKAPKEKQEIMAKATQELKESGVAQGLKAGDQVPAFTLPNAAGEQISIQEVLKQGPVILTFYRGGWCPYCNLELKAYQRELSSIKEAGASLIAISPEKPDASLSTKEKNDLQFTVLSDDSNEVAEQFDLVFKMPEDLIAVYKDSGLDVPGHNGNNDWELPKPATFVIDSSGEIIFAEVESDYTKRVEPSKVVQVVKETKSK